jgi:fatty acid desaturase
MLVEAPSSAELETQLPRYDRSALAEAVKPLYRLSNARGAFGIFWCWAWVAAAVTFARCVDHWLAYVVAYVVIAGRQVGLSFLVHEAAHHRVFKNRYWGDRIVNLFVAYPLGVYVGCYRQHHLQHHRALNTSTDPDWLLHQNEFWRWPRSTQSAFGTFAKSVLGLHANKWFGVFRLSPWSNFRRLPLIDRASFVIFVGALSLGLTWSHGWLTFLGLWIAPMFTLGFCLHHLRTIAEHLAVTGTHELNASRTVVSSPIERFLVAPMGINFHLEHHLFPGVPAYNLHKVHDLLIQDEAFRSLAQITPSYFGLRRGLLREITLPTFRPR